MMNPEEPETWLSLTQMREEMPKGKWRHSRFFEDIGVAVKMQMTPSSFWQMDESDQALIIARLRALSTMEAYEQHLADKAAKDPPKRGGKRR